MGPLDSVDESANAVDVAEDAVDIVTSPLDTGGAEEKEADSSGGFVSNSVRKLLDHKSDKVKQWKYKDGMVCNL